MKYASILLAATAASGAFVPAAHADAGHAAKHRHARHHVTKSATTAKSDPMLNQEVAELRAEVNALHQQLDTQHQVQVATQSQVAQSQSQVGMLNQQVAEAPKVAKTEAKKEVAVALEQEHRKGYSDFKGIRLTPGGFLEMAGVYRQHYQGNDIATNWAIPFANNRPSYVNEGRFSARQSRVSMLAQGNANKNTVLTMYGEFDFLGGAQTANANESNSFNPRVRHLYGAIDWNHDGGGVHFLAGQTWSLVTMNTKGITPRNELTPPQIEAQYIPGFVWTRQPQLRLTVDTADHKLWAAISAENSATTFVGTVPAIVTNTAPAGSGFDSANTLSLNGTPDFVGKVAYEATIAGRSLHLEGFALSRTFTAHINGGGNVNKAGYGFGGGVVFQALPKILDVQFSGIGGKGIGRYGSAQLPDVTFAADGTIHPVREFMLLGGATLHATKMLDIYAFGGEEQEFKADQGGGYGIGLITANNAGCYIEGGTCAGNTRRIRQLTGGFWQKIYSGSFGRAQVGMQYSYTERQLFNGAGGTPQANQSIGLVSFRYYPF
jgi:hypothetical protein